MANGSWSSSEMALRQCLCLDCSTVVLYAERMSSYRLLRMLKCSWICRLKEKNVLYYFEVFYDFLSCPTSNVRMKTLTAGTIRLSVIREPKSLFSQDVPTTNWVKMYILIVVFTWKRVQPKCFISEIMDFETFDVDGMVRANVGYSRWLDTAESRHFCIIQSTHLPVAMTTGRCVVN